ncbi:MAG TPA: hypothetical protein VHZ07_01980 [Bryobacteraceae bacterium]|jgi:hypothetical protein|nr:hypothetical protein [Bryobacteraceae bacterium]
MNISKYTKQLMVAVGLLALPFSVRVEKQVPAKPAKPAPAKSPTAPEIKVDRRTVRLTNFFCRLRCPVSNLAQEFVTVADENRLDWRLLPSISVIESGGGKAFRNNNILGWSNGGQVFPSIGSGIRVVAYKLGRSPLYRNRDSRGKLLIYNPNPEYAEKVEDVMKQISPVVNVRPVYKVLRRGSQQFAYNAGLAH